MFFDHIREKFAGGNLSFMQIASKISSDAFCHLMPLVYKANENGIFIESARKRVMETYFYDEEGIGLNNCYLIWASHSLRQDRLFTLPRV